MPKQNHAIGVFDSGLGGLTVVKELMRQMPGEDVVYFGDTARVPYGTKSAESIVRFSKENVAVLLRHKVKMIVVACNSSSSHALGTLKKTYTLPILGVIEPGVKKAVAVTKKRTVGVIATPATINSGAYARQIRRSGRRIKVISQACPLFVPLVEEGWFNRAETISIAGEYLSGIRRAKADALILGCTHYPLLKQVLRKVMGPKVYLVDSAREVAQEARALLVKKGLARAGKRKGKYLFLVSDEPKHFQKLARRFLGCPVGKVKRV